MARAQSVTSKPTTQAEAFAAWRAALGPNQTFDWTNPRTGKVETISTNYANEVPQQVIGNGEINTSRAGVLAKQANYVPIFSEGTKTAYADPSTNEVIVQQTDAMGNPVGGSITYAGEAPAGFVQLNKLAGDVARTGLALPASAFGELGQFFSDAVTLSTGMDRNSSFYKKATDLKNFGDKIMPNEIKSQEQNIKNDIAAADGIGKKAATFFISAFENPLGAGSFARCIATRIGY
jgi:hypothetical protein